MLIDLNRPKNLSIIYAVARDLCTALEEDVGAGCRDLDKIMILSGCYSIIDYTANLLAALGIDDDDCPEIAVRSDHYLVAPELIKDLVSELESNLQDDKCQIVVDYKKVQALAGLHSVIPYIEKLTRIM